MGICSLGIQICKSKLHLNMEALSIYCRNKHWPQCLNRILISSAGSTSICSAIVVQAALESRAACTTTAGHIEVEPADEIKIRLKHCGQCLFLQSMLSASIFKWIFDFRIWISIVDRYQKMPVKLTTYCSILILNIVGSLRRKCILERSNRASFQFFAIFFFNKVHLGIVLAFLLTRTSFLMYFSPFWYK